MEIKKLLELSNTIGEDIKKKILEVIEKTGCEKVNIIAHSKGGLDSRYAISILGMDKYTASLTTISTPHRGCILLIKCAGCLKNYIEELLSFMIICLKD